MAPPPAELRQLSKVEPTTESAAPRKEITAPPSPADSQCSNVESRMWSGPVLTTAPPSLAAEQRRKVLCEISSVELSEKIAPPATELCPSRKTHEETSPVDPPLRTTPPPLDCELQPEIVNSTKRDPAPDKTRKGASRKVLLHSKRIDSTDKCEHPLTASHTNAAPGCRVTNAPWPIMLS
eukprot:161030-Rhodomonas_salina.2